MRKKHWMIGVILVIGVTMLVGCDSSTVNKEDHQGGSELMVSVDDVDFSDSETFLEYKFYDVNESEDCIITFMPDNVMFSFERGTYDIEHRGNESVLVLNNSYQMEEYVIKGANEDGYVQLASDENFYEWKTTATEDETGNGLLVGEAPFENYATYNDQNSNMDITFETDGTFLRKTEYKYYLSENELIIFRGTEDGKIYSIGCDAPYDVITIDEQKELESKYTLRRVDNFDENGIEEGVFIGMGGREFQYMRVLITVNENAPVKKTTYRVIYTDDLNISGEDIYQDIISSTFIPGEEKAYQGLYVW